MNQPQRRRRPLNDSLLKKAWRACLYLFFDLLHSVNMADDAIRDRPNVRTRVWNTLVFAGGRLARGTSWVLSTLVRLPWTCGTLLARMIWPVVARPWSSVKRVYGRLVTSCHELLDNLGLLHDGIEGRRGLVRQIVLVIYSGGRALKLAWRFSRNIGFFLLSEVLYHLGLISDSLDVRRVWTRAMTWRVLPAVLFGLTMIGLTARVVTTDSQETAARYAVAGGEAFRHQEYPAAAVYLQRLVEMQELNGVAQYHLALSADAIGEHERCWAIMSMLAPPNRPGFWPAHLWQAKFLLNQPSPTITDLTMAWAHLQRTIAQKPDESEAHFLLATTLWTLQDNPNVALNLEKAAPSRPELWLFLAGQRRDQGKPEEAAHYARRTASALTPQLRKDPSNSTTRLLLAMALSTLNDFSAAENVVRDGLSQQDGPFWRTVLAQLYLAWSESSSAAGPQNAVERCARMRQAIEVDPWNPLVIRHLLKVHRQKGPEADWATTTLAALDWRAAPAAARVEMSLDDWAHGRKQQAREHLEAAYRMEPTLIGAANNLAWVLCETEPSELPRALELVNTAMKLPAPSNTIAKRSRIPSKTEQSLLDTRGQILTKMQRWNEALADLELLAKYRADDKSVHRALATCYAGLGMHDLAEYQRRLSEIGPPEIKPTP